MAGATAGAEDIGAEDSVAGEFYISPAALVLVFELVAADSKGVGAG
jgi:hypothetical protein